MSKNTVASRQAAVQAEHLAGVGQGGVNTPIVRLGDPQVAVEFNAIKARIDGDPTYARLLLKRAGIITTKGNLTKRFGG